MTSKIQLLEYLHFDLGYLEDEQSALCQVAWGAPPTETLRKEFQDKGERATNVATTHFKRIVHDLDLRASTKQLTPTRKNSMHSQCSYRLLKCHMNTTVEEL